jgi:hypothetical protein
MQLNVETWIYSKRIVKEAHQWRVQSGKCTDAWTPSINRNLDHLGALKFLLGLVLTLNGINFLLRMTKIFKIELRISCSLQIPQRSSLDIPISLHFPHINMNDQNQLTWEVASKCRKLSMAVRVNLHKTNSKIVSKRMESICQILHKLE